MNCTNNILRHTLIFWRLQLFGREEKEVSSNSLELPCRGSQSYSNDSRSVDGSCTLALVQPSYRLQLFVRMVEPGITNRPFIRTSVRRNLFFTGTRKSIWVPRSTTPNTPLPFMRRPRLYFRSANVASSTST